MSNFNRTARPRSTESSFPVAVAVLALAAVYVSVTARDTNVYREPPRAQLVAEIRHPNFDAIRVSPQAASYVESVIFCSGKYPAQKTAVIPDNPGLYPLLGIDNPFAVDWWLTAEQPPDHSERVRQTVAELNKDRDFLVLFQTYDAGELGSRVLSEIREPQGIFVHNPDDADILGLLEGDSVTCSSFFGKYSAKN